MAKRETSSQDCQTPSPDPAEVTAKLPAYCQDIDRWAQSWAGFPDRDIPAGERIMAEMASFLLAVIAERRTKKTVKPYAEYLWILGGEIIRRTHCEEKHHKLSGRALILKYIHAQGGPLWNDPRYVCEYGAYNTVCGSLYRFLTAGKPWNAPTNSAEEPESSPVKKLRGQNAGSSRGHVLRRQRSQHSPWPLIR